MPNRFDNRFGDNHKDEWLTPKFITDALGPFDLDPCSPVGRPWDTAAKHFTIVDNGLIQEWGGGRNSRVFESSIWKRAESLDAKDGKARQWNNAFGREN